MTSPAVTTPTDLAAVLAELTGLRAEVARLRDAVGPPSDGRADPGGEPGREPVAGDESRHRRFTRRGLLAAAAAGGAGLVAEGVVRAAPAAAAPGNPLVMGANNDAGGSVTILNAATGAQGAVLGLINPDTPGTAIGLYAQLGAKSGLAGAGTLGAVVGDAAARYGVVGLSSDRSGVLGFSTTDKGVYGVSNESYGVVGQCNGNGAGVVGDSGPGTGVVGLSIGGAGVAGTSESGDGVSGESTSAVGAHGVSGSSDGVYGRSTTGTGVHAYSDSGTGVQATSGGNADGVTATSTRGCGLVASGPRAQVRLVPGRVVGRPTTGNHLVGDLYLDKTANLFVCTATGNPGTWRKVTTTVA